MPVAIAIKVDISAITRRLAGLASRQIPFATASALTAIAKASQGEITRELPTIFKKVSPLTRRSIAIKPATRAAPIASVFVKDLQNRYLSLEEFGGTRTTADNTRRVSRALVMPGAKARLNASGNLPYGYVQRLAQQAAAKAVSAPAATGKRDAKARPTVVELKNRGPNGRGPGGFFMRLPGDKLVRLISFVPEAQYVPKFGFVPRVTAFSASVAPSLLRAAIERALSTAR